MPTIWLPVESDSQIITQYAHKLGMKESHEFIDLFSFDSSTAVEFGIPVNQCKAIILLFPIGENDAEVEEKLENYAGRGQIKFVKQTIENSCCLMALLHIFLNASESLLDTQRIPEIMKKLKEESSEKGESLEALIENSEELAEIHKEVAGFGETDLPDVELEDVNFHFVALIPNKSDSGIVLLDGRRGGPVVFEAKFGENNFFDSACRVAREEFVEKSADQTNFAAVILI